MTDGGVEPSTQQGSVISTLMVSGHLDRQAPLWVSHQPPSWSLAPLNGLWGPVPPVTDIRTESPQQFSSTRRRLSTEAMQLREVGKLAMYLWKMWWLQRPSHQAHPGLGSCWVDVAPLAAARCAPGWVTDAQAHPVTGWSGPPTTVMSIKWPTWNCCCAGESDC